MMATILISTILLGITTILQSTWFKSASLFGVNPDISMLILIWISFNNRKTEGPVSGFLAGFIEDFISSAPLGFHAFTRTLIAFLSSMFNGSFQIDRVLMPMIFGVAATLLKAVSALLLFWVFGESIFRYSITEPYLWMECLLNGLLSPLVFALMSRGKKYFITEDSSR